MSRSRLKYHVSEDGKVRVCRARPGNCPKTHFPGTLEALKAFYEPEINRIDDARRYAIADYDDDYTSGIRHVLKKVIDENSRKLTLRTNNKNNPYQNIDYWIEQDEDERRPFTKFEHLVRMSTLGLSDGGRIDYVLKIERGHYFPTRHSVDTFWKVTLYERPARLGNKNWRSKLDDEYIVYTTGYAPSGDEYQVRAVTEGIASAHQELTHRLNTYKEVIERHYPGQHLVEFQDGNGHPKHMTEHIFDGQTMEEFTRDMNRVVRTVETNAPDGNPLAGGEVNNYTKDSDTLNFRAKGSIDDPGYNFRTLHAALIERNSENVPSYQIALTSGDPSNDELRWAVYRDNESWSLHYLNPKDGKRYAGTGTKEEVAEYFTTVHEECGFGESGFLDSTRGRIEEFMSGVDDMIASHEDYALRGQERAVNRFNRYLEEKEREKFNRKSGFQKVFGILSGNAPKKKREVVGAGVNLDWD